MTCLCRRNNRTKGREGGASKRRNPDRVSNWRRLFSVLLGERGYLRKNKKEIEENIRRRVSTEKFRRARMMKKGQNGRAAPAAFKGKEGE